MNDTTRLPSFLERVTHRTGNLVDPPMNASRPPVERTARIHPETTSVVDSILTLSKERDSLREECTRLIAENGDQMRELAFLRRSLSEITRHRDFYQRHATALFTRLQDIHLIIARASEDAAKEANTPPPTTDPTAQIEAAVEQTLTSTEGQP